MQTYIYDFADTANGAVNASTLADEIEAGASWSVPFDGVVIRLGPSKIEANFDDPGLSAGEQTTLAGIVAAHVGVETAEHIAAVRKIALDSNATGTWQDVITLTTPALTKGWYRVSASCSINTAAAPVTPFTDWAQGRLQEEVNGGGATSIRFFSGLSDAYANPGMIRMVFCQHGDVLEYKLAHRRQGAATSEVRDAVISIEPWDGPVS